jgi:hypothetical protein
MRANDACDIDSEFGRAGAVHPFLGVAEALRRRGHRVTVRITHSQTSSSAATCGPGCSILGNTLERGFGICPNGDHFQAQCGMEVVPATGGGVAHWV